MMSYSHLSGRTLILATLWLATVLSITITTPASAQSLKAYKSSGSLVFQTDGGSVSNSHGATIGNIEGNSYYLVAKFDGSSIYDARGSLIGKLDNESLSNSHGAGIGKIEGAGGLDDPPTVFLASLLLGII
jgi:hypothetical protein